MKLVFLYGPPAVGKLTVAHAVAALTGWPLVHNHLVVDLALALYPFGSPGFVTLREELWWMVLGRALQDRTPGLIFTFNPENSVPQRFIDELFAEFPAQGGAVIGVELTASEAEIERRLGAESRRQHRKLADVNLYRQLRAAGVFSTPRIPAAHLRIDTEVTPPPAAAARIREFL